MGRRLCLFWLILYSFWISFSSWLLLCNLLCFFPSPTRLPSQPRAPLSTMDCGVRKMPNKACFPPPIQTHIKNQNSHSSCMSHDAMTTFAEPIPSPRRWSPTYQPRRRSRQVPSLSFVPSPVMPRIESHDYTTTLTRRPLERGPAYMSPFRSVRRMKEPFQLMLPTSPASVDSAPCFPEKPMRTSKLPGGHSLRTWRSDQNLTCTNMETFGLLPSPPISESRPASAGPESSYFDSRSSSETDDSKEETETETETDTENATGTDAENERQGETVSIAISDEGRISYQAYRPPDWKDQPRTDVMNVHEAHSEFVRQCEANNEEGSKAPDNSVISITSPKSVYSEKNFPPGSSPRPQRPRTATVSSEASWVPSNFSYCERWLQNVPVDRIDDKDTPPRVVNRRKVQIVENDPPMPKLDIIPGAKALEEPVRFVVASKTKPKLVDIARQSSPSIPLPPPPSLQPQIVPTTPDQRQEEVSAFSPDTPLDMSDSGYGTRDSGYSIESYDDPKDDDDAYTDPGSLTSDSVTSTVVCERPESSHGEQETFPHPAIRSGSVSPTASSQDLSDSPVGSSNMSDKEEEKQRLWHHEWTLDDHEWTLDELDHSVKDFPRHMLRLTSPVIVFLRKNDEKALLRPFRTIFPDVTENLLDCLCAALLARNYLLSLSTINRRKRPVSNRNDSYAVDAVPTKAYSTLGIQIPSGSPAKMTSRLLGSRSADLRRELERIIDNLLFAICGRSDPTLKSAVEVLAQVLETNA